MVDMRLVRVVNRREYLNNIQNQDNNKKLDFMRLECMEPGFCLDHICHKTKLKY